MKSDSVEPILTNKGKHWNENHVTNSILNLKLRSAFYPYSILISDFNHFVGPYKFTRTYLKLNLLFAYVVSRCNTFLCICQITILDTHTFVQLANCSGIKFGFSGGGNAPFAPSLESCGFIGLLWALLVTTVYSYPLVSATLLRLLCWMLTADSWAEILNLRPRCISLWICEYIIEIDCSWESGYWLRVQK